MAYIPKVFDVRPDGHSSFDLLPRLGENDFADLQAFYKFEMDFTYGFDRAQPGERWFGIYAIELKAGPAVFQPQVQNEDGSLILTPPGILLFNYWPGADLIGFEADPPYFDRAVFSFTRDEGSLGWGFGPDDFIGDGGGAHAFWASADPPTAENRRVGSDCLKKVGWWDDHIVPNPIFRVMTKAGNQPPPRSGDSYVSVVVNGVERAHVDLRAVIEVA